MFDFGCVSKAFRKPYITVNEGRAIFEGLLESFSEWENRLFSNARIVENYVFASSGSKVQDNREEELTATNVLRLHFCKMRTVRRKPWSIRPLCRQASRNFLKMQKRISDKAKYWYVDLRFVRCTSSI